MLWVLSVLNCKLRPSDIEFSLPHQQAQRCIVSNALLAKEGHCIDLGTGIVAGAKEPDVLDAGRQQSPGRGMFLTGYFTLPISDGAFIASCVIDVGVAAMQLTVAQYQDAPTPTRLSHSRIIPEVPRAVTTAKLLTGFDV